MKGANFVSRPQAPLARRVDVRRRSGIFGATWPMQDFYSPIPVFRLDHIMASEELEIRGWESIAVSNSDHRGLRVWF